jgi:hypothetical protein
VPSQGLIPQYDHLSRNNLVLLTRLDGVFDGNASVLESFLERGFEFRDPRDGISQLLTDPLEFSLQHLDARQIRRNEHCSVQTSFEFRDHRSAPFDLHQTFGGGGLKNPEQFVAVLDRRSQRVHLLSQNVRRATGRQCGGAVGLGQRRRQTSDARRPG